MSTVDVIVTLTGLFSFVWGSLLSIQSLADKSSRSVLRRMATTCLYLVSGVATVVFSNEIMTIVAPHWGDLLADTITGLLIASGALTIQAIQSLPPMIRLTVAGGVMLLGATVDISLLVIIMMKIGGLRL